MKDNFSRQAEAYSRHRPTYPKELFDFILQHVQPRNTAWDCATGNGQTATELASHFEKVYATDISQRQLDNATVSPRIQYSLQPAEKTNFPDNSIDLVTVSQALHWFDFDEFYAEVNRVGNTGSWIAVWSYSLLRISTAIDEILNHYHFHTLAKYWDPERVYVDANYTTIPFPFIEIATPVLAIECYWTTEDLAGYLQTWSALPKYMEEHRDSPVPGIINEIRPLWEDEKMRIIFPLHLRMGQIKK